MEKKKLLLVAISVGTFLVIVIGASILFFTPKNAVSAVTAAPIPAGSPGAVARVPAENGPASVDPADMIRNSEGLQGLQSPPPSPAAIQQENNFYINSDVPGEAYVVEKTDQDPKTQMVINVPRPKTAAVPDTPPPPRQQAVPAAKPQTAPSGGTTGGNTGGGASKKPAPAPKPAAAVYDAYWVQTGSFSARNHADTVKETLASKGITSIIENRDINGKTSYRVRVGPYVSRNEADYWLSRIKLIEGFQDSQVWKSQARLN
jgi:DedD protein